MISADNLYKEDRKVWTTAAQEHELAVISSIEIKVHDIPAGRRYARAFLPLAACQEIIQLRSCCHVTETKQVQATDTIPILGDVGGGVSRCKS